MSVSEVVRIREQIELECQALHLAMYGYAEVARHEIIAHKYNTLRKYQEQLEPLVGGKEATAIVVEAYGKAMG